MPARIDEVSLTSGGLLYLSVSWWATRAGLLSGRDPAIRNDFVIQVPPAQISVPVLDADGVPTGDMQTVTVDRRAYVRQVVVDFFKRAVAARWLGDLTDQRIRRTTQDRDGLLALFAGVAGSTVDT